MVKVAAGVAGPYIGFGVIVGMLWRLIWLLKHTLHRPAGFACFVQVIASEANLNGNFLQDFLKESPCACELLAG